MKNYRDKWIGVAVCEHIIKDICMIDEDTPLIIFEKEKNGTEGWIEICVEYHTDERRYVFTDNYMDEYGNYYKHLPSTHLDDDEKSMCESIIMLYLKQV